MHSSKDFQGLTCAGAGFAAGGAALVAMPAVGLNEAWGEDHFFGDDLGVFKAPPKHRKIIYFGIF